MQLKLNQLESHLQKKLAPLYLISGEDPLLKQEARDLVFQRAKQAGYDSQQRLNVEARFDWNRLLQLNSNQDLFNQKESIEIINPESRFDASATKVLGTYCENMSPDSLLLILCGKLNSAQLRSKWYQQIDKMGVCITLWPLNTRELQEWIHDRFTKAQLLAKNDVIKLLAELCENNLLAAQQAIEKLKLLYPNQTEISADQLMKAVSDSSRFNVFDLVNYLLQGNSERSLHVLNGLEQQGIEPTLVLWALAKETRSLSELLSKQEQGQSLAKLIEAQPYNKRAYLQIALRRLNSSVLKQALLRLTQIDQIIKGVKPGNAWLELRELSLGLSGLSNFLSKDGCLL